MKPLTKAIAVALIQTLLVCSLGAKLLYDRRTCPRAWFKAHNYDPNLPIRGRYVSLQVEVADPRSPEELRSKFGGELKGLENQNAPYSWRGFGEFGRECGSVVLRDGRPVASFDGSPFWGCNNLSFARRKTGDETTLRLAEPILFFISDTAKDPSRMASGDELWVLATIPRKGPPRPIVLGVKKAGETVITLLQIK
jgi:hypothetical protein